MLFHPQSLTMGAVNRDSVLGASLVLVLSLVILLGVTVYFQTSLSLLQQQVDNDREQMSQYEVLLVIIWYLRMQFSVS